MMVGAYRAGPVTQIGLPLHQGAVADLLQRLELDPAARHIDGPGQVAVPGSRLAEQVAQVHALALDLSSGIEQPVVIDTGQEVAAVLGDRRGGMHQAPLVITGRCRRHGRRPPGVKDAQVDAARPGVTPAKIRRRHHERLLVAQQLPQLVQFAAQVGQGLRVSRVRPEQAGDPLPGLGDPAWTAKKATRATARDESARAPVLAPVMVCSPRSDTLNTSTRSP